MPVNIRRRGQRVVLTYPASEWSPNVGELCKSVSGCRWAAGMKAWTYPLSMDTLHQLRAAFGQRLNPDADLVAWARAEREREQRTRGYAAHHDATLAILPHVAPTLAIAMADRTYQRSGARWGAVAGNFCLADEPGLGKTAVSLAAIAESGRWAGQHLVVSPKTAITSTWARQIREWTDAKVHAMPEGYAKRSDAWLEFLADAAVLKPGEAVFLVVNPAMLRRQYGKLCKRCDVWEEDVKAGRAKWNMPAHRNERGHNPARAIRKEDWPAIIEHGWTTIIVDEAHEHFAAYKPSNVTQSVQGLLDARGEAQLIALTGTPLRGQESNIWGTLDWLKVNTGGYWGFMDRYMETADGFFGLQVYGLDPDKATDFNKLLDRYMLRRTRAEVRPDLPLGQRVDVTLPLEGAHRKQYQEFEHEGEVALSNGTLSGQGLLSELTRLKQLAYGQWHWQDGKLVATESSPVLEWLLQFLANRGVTGKKTTTWMPERGVAFKYVVVSQFTEVLDAVGAALKKRGIETLAITGAVTGARRNAAVSSFQRADAANAEVRVMLLQTQTGGVSIDLDAWCDEMVILDETWVADDQVQVEGRINNRSGRVSPRLWHYVRVEETIQQRIAERNYAQHDMEHRLLDKRRGVQTALHLLGSTT